MRYLHFLNGNIIIGIRFITIIIILTGVSALTDDYIILMHAKIMHANDRWEFKITYDLLIPNSYDYPVDEFEDNFILLFKIK